MVLMQNYVVTGFPLTSEVAALQPGVAWVKEVSGELTQPASDSRHTPNSILFMGLPVLKHTASSRRLRTRIIPATCWPKAQKGKVAL